MKTILMLLLLSVPAFAQETQVAPSFVLRNQTQLGYEPHNVGVKVEGDYKFNDAWTVLASTTFMHTPKHDSGTGNSWFGGGGARWTPLQYKQTDIFGEFDMVGGYLSTKLYSKGVAHFRTGIGVRLLDHHLLLEVSRLYQDMLPDAAKKLKEAGFDPSVLHATFNQLSAWDYEAQYWSKPFTENSKWGLKYAIRFSASKGVDAFERIRRGWLAQFEVGPYRRF